MSSFLYSVVVSQKKQDSSGVNTDLATDDAKKLFEVNIFFYDNDWRPLWAAV